MSEKNNTFFIFAVIGPMSSHTEFGEKEYKI